ATIANTDFPALRFGPDVPCRRLNAAWEQARSRPPGFVRTRTPSNHRLLRPGRWLRWDHVWTARWQELSYVFAALVGCGHVSGLLMRQVWPLALMLCADRVPKQNHAL